MPGLRADAPEFFPASWGQMTTMEPSAAEEEQQAEDYFSEVRASRAAPAERTSRRGGGLPVPSSVPNTSATLVPRCLAAGVHQRGGAG